MSSRKYEVDHQERLRELLSRAGLECLRPPPPSIITDSEEIVEHEEILEVYEEEHDYKNVIEKEECSEETLGVIEETPEVGAEIFPTPSLRRLIPERQRRIEEMNRIQVLPEIFMSNFDPEAIPMIVDTPLNEVIDVLGDMTGCKSYKKNLAEFWFLDTLANLLRRAQEDEMGKSNVVASNKLNNQKLNTHTTNFSKASKPCLGAGSQGILISWFCEWMKEVQHFDAADRQRMIRRFQDNITAAAKFIAHNYRLPTPEEVGITYEAKETQEPKTSNAEDQDEVTNTESASKVDEGTKGKKGGRLDKKGKSKTQKGKSDKQGKRIRNKYRGKKAEQEKKDNLSIYKVTNYDSPTSKDDIKSEPEIKSEEENGSNVESFQCALIDLTHITHYIYDLFSTDYQYNLIRAVFTFSPEYVHVDAPYQMNLPKKLLPQQNKLVLDKDSTKTSLVLKKDRKSDYGKLVELQEREERYLAEQEMNDQADWLRRSHILPLSAQRDTLHSAAAGTAINSDRRR